MTPDVVCLGILVADVIARPFHDLPAAGSLGFVETVSLHGGGCALNTATVLTRLGCTASVAGKVGADPFGDFLLQLLDERAVDRRGVIRDPAAPTSATVVLVGDDGERTFIHAKGANAQLEASELDRELLFSGRCLHVAGALVLDALDGEPLATLLQEGKARGLLTSVDTVWDASGRWERIVPSLPYVDVFAPSLPEARAISGQTEADAAARWLQDRGAANVVVKLGAHGCHLGGVGRVEPIHVDAVDATGAGDAFVAGLLYGVLQDWPLERAAKLANAAGALAATAVGASDGVHGLDEMLALAGLE